MKPNLTVATCLLSVIALQVCSAQENEKTTKKPDKVQKTNELKNSYSDASTNSEDMENPFVPPPMPSLPVSSEEEPLPFQDRGAANGESEEFMGPNGGGPEAGRAQRYIGPNAIDPYFYINPLNPLPRRQVPSFRYYPYELFMVVQPKQCSNATESNSTDVAIKFLGSSSNPEPSRCVFAVTACCAPSSYHVRFPCFEMLGCYGAFWDINPCNDEVVSSAVNELAAFYNAVPEPENSTTTVAPDSPPPEVTTVAPAAS